MGRSVSVIDTRTERVIRRILLSPPTNPQRADHPNAIVANPRRNEVYTANGNSDTVSVIDTRRNRVKRTMAVWLGRGGRTGSMPNGLAVAPDGKRLYVALGGENAIAVLDLVKRKRIGFIPAAWNPTDIDITRDGKRLVVTTANAAGRRPRRCAGPYAVGDCSTGDYAYTAAAGVGKPSTKGGLTVVRTPRSKRTLRKLTRRVRRNNRVDARVAPKPKPLRAIRHVIYVIKENRTYDQVLGSLGKGDGDPSLNLFGDDSAPNHRELARRFTLFDNFFADADVSADGISWTVSAGVSDYVDKTWPITYSPGRPKTPPRSRLRGHLLRRAVPDRAAGVRPHDLPRRGGAHARLPVGQRVPARRVVPQLRDVHPHPRRLPRRGQHLGHHAPRRHAASATTSTSATRASTSTAPTTPTAFPSGSASSARTRRRTGRIPPGTRCPRSRSCGSRTTTPSARGRASRSPRATSPTTTSRSASSSIGFRTARSGPTRRSS